MNHNNFAKHRKPALMCKPILNLARVVERLAKITPSVPNAYQVLIFMRINDRVQVSLTINQV